MTTQTGTKHDATFIPGFTQIRNFVQNFGGGAMALSAANAPRVQCKKTVRILGMEFTKKKWFDGDTCPPPWHK